VSERISVRDRRGERSALRRLAAEPERMTELGLWRALGEEVRGLAVRCALEHGAEGQGEAVVHRLAKQLNFRPQTLESWPPEKVAGYGRHLQLRNRPLIQDLLRLLHVHARADLLASFLDRLEIPHEGGLITDDASPELPPEPEALEAAADELFREAAEPDEVLAYFLTLFLLSRDRWAPLAGWLRSRFADAGEDRREGTEEEEVGEEGPADQAEEEPRDEFTTLDRQLVRAIVDVAQGVEGALSEDQLDDLVEEVISLNSARHRSFFHAGFSDVVLGREPRGDLRAENAPRRAWYWAGYVSGLARLGRWEAIVEAYDGREVVRGLGRTGRGPSNAAAHLVVRALLADGRPGEAAAFLEPAVLVRLQPRQLFEPLHEEGVRLLRADRAAEARPIFDLLKSAIDELTALGMDPANRRFLEVRRRRAHCFRQLRDFPRARDLLEGLLEDERDPEIRAMVHSDLGLIDAGFRNLAEIRLPAEEDRRSDLVDALERGRSRFERATSTNARYASHGHYALGMLALGKGEYEEAGSHLELALSGFAAEPQRYRQGGLLAYARLTVGVALALGLSTPRGKRDAELIVSAVRDGADIPSYVLPEVLQALSLHSEERAREVAEGLLEHRGPESLEILADTLDAHRSPSVAEALLERAEDEARGDAARARDFRRILPLLLRQKRAEDAATVLDRLEGFAVRHIDREAFIELLRDPERYRPAWSVEDARNALVIALECEGEYRSAAELLAEDFHCVLSGRRFGWHHEGEELVERIRGYGLDDGRVAPLERRLEALVAEETPGELEGGDAPEPVDVLVVGGDERQARYDEQIEAWFEENHPHVRVEFFHTGWSGNWGRRLEGARRALVGKDAVVIMRFIRTEFGRQLRKDLEIPWCGCHGTGPKMIRRSVLRAVELAGGEDLEAMSSTA